MRRHLRWILAITALGLAAASCAPTASSGTNASESEGGLVLASATSTTAATVRSPGTSASSSGPVTVTVQAGEFSFHSALTTFRVGVPYHFVVTNSGMMAHEFLLVKPIPQGTMDLDAMDKMAVADIEDSDLPPGATKSVDVTFAHPYRPGTLEMACHVGDHYQLGMHLAVVVVP